MDVYACGNRHAALIHAHSIFDSLQRFIPIIIHRINWLAGDAVFFCSPLTEIYQFASFAAERSELAGVTPGRWLLTGWAIYTAIESVTHQLV
tara:strand:- start:275 stop:550 length:276 start_codon:yes stop_codon:yes gene_type:complete